MWIVTWYVMRCYGNASVDFLKRSLQAVDLRVPYPISLAMTLFACSLSTVLFVTRDDILVNMYNGIILSNC